MLKNGFMLSLLILLVFSACAAQQPLQSDMPSSAPAITEEPVSGNSILSTSAPTESSPTPTSTLPPATLLYQGQASLSIITSEGKVIYFDP